MPHVPSLAKLKSVSTATLCADKDELRMNLYAPADELRDLTPSSVLSWLMITEDAGIVPLTNAALSGGACGTLFDEQTKEIVDMVIRTAEEVLHHHECSVDTAARYAVKIVASCRTLEAVMRLGDLQREKQHHNPNLVKQTSKPKLGSCDVYGYE